MSRARARVLLLLVLLGGAILRFQGLNWDEGHHLHPDERFISMVEEKLSPPKSFREYFDSSKSPLDPYNRGEGSFVYGTLPMLMAKAVGAPLKLTGYDGAFRVGRALSGVFDLITVWLVYRITRRFARRRAALFAAALLAFCALGIQLSHFWSVDTFLTTFSAAALLGAIRIAQGRSGRAGEAATGLAIGLAAACKITALALFLPVGIALLVRAFASWPAEARPRAIRRLLFSGLLIFLLAAAAVRAFLPHVFLGPSPFSFRLDPRWLKDLRDLTRLSSSVAGFPPALQWAGRTLFFPVENFVLWCAGVPFGIAAIAAFVWSGAAVVRRRAWALAPLVAHVLFLFLYHGITLVKSIRYFYPAYPALAALTGVAFWSWLARARFPAFARAVTYAVLGGTVLWAVAFTSVYRHTNTRVAATRWIFAHVPAGSAFGNEAWDDGLPMPEPGGDVARYAGPAFALFDPDTPRKVDEIVDALTKSDWIAVTSGRVYMNVTRVPDVYPMSIAYYRALFDGSLGFDRAADFTSYPSLGPLRFPDDRAEEQWTVYDHPRVLLFKKTKRFSPAAARAMLLAALPATPATMQDWERWPRTLRRVSEPVRPDRRPAAETSAATEPPSAGSIRAALVWYLALLLVGAVAAPLCFAAFPNLADRGLGFARVFGLVLVTFVLTLALTYRYLPNGRPAAGACLALLAAFSGVVFLRNRHDFVAFLRDNRRALLRGEAVFAFGFLLFLGIRALNPEIYWGEKPMDYSILNILVRAKSLPTSDPWLAGAPLGYYTFGQEMVVFLTLLTNLSTRLTFNLAFGLLGGVILQGAYSLARSLGGGERAGFAGAALMGVIGNLSGLREWRLNHRALDWDYFWATSRVIKDTINEYPFWSVVFADLHAHVLAIPILLLFLAAALNLVRLHADPPARWRRRLASAALLGFIAAAEALTNAWDVPLLCGLFAAMAVCTALAPDRLSFRGVGRALAALLVSAGTAYVLARLLWVRAGAPPAIGRNLEPSSSGFDQATVFGLFFYLAIGWWLASASSRLADRGLARLGRWAIVTLVAAGLGFLLWRRPDAFLAAAAVLFLGAFLARPDSRDDRFACALAASAFLLVLFAQRFYIYDRMNTFFKLYLEAWILFAIATAALVFGAGRRGAIGRWALPARIGLGILAAAALFTSATAGRAAVSRHFAPYVGPSLDGLGYLEKQRPGEYLAVMWLRQNVRGTPVVLEAQGPSYQDFGRISMLTGLPTVLGWDYHVQQRGNPQSEIETRKSAVQSMYASPDAARAAALLRRYRVAYVYVGPLERKTYPAAGLRKFATNPELFETVYENPEVRIYRVAGVPTQDSILPFRETLPQPEASAGPQDEPEETPEIAARAAADQPLYANLKEPRGAAVDSRQRLWVADFGHSRIRVYDENGGFLGGWGGRGSGAHGLREPCGVAAHGDSLYVADTWNGRVLAFDLEGNPRGSAGDLYGPRGIAVAPDGRVWVSDTGNHRVASFAPDLTDPRYYGRKGAGPQDFSSPIGIAVAPSGEVFVADTSNKRIRVLGPDGAARRNFPVPAWGENVEPHLAIADDGTIYATDPGPGAVLVLDPSGTLQERLAADEAGRRFENPTGVAIDPKDRILYVVSSGNSSIARMPLAQKKTPARTAP